MTGRPGIRVLVTRPPGAWARLVARFDAAGVAVDLEPTTRAVEPADGGPGERALDVLDSYDWLVVTSGRGVAALAMRLASRGLDRLPEGLRVAAVGPATARALDGIGIAVALVAEESRGEGLVRALSGKIASGQGVLIVRPEGGPGLLSSALRALGARVVDAPLYRTVPSERASDLASSAIGRRWAAVAFSAPSSLDLWLTAAGERSGDLRAALSAMARVAIGPTTAAHLAACSLAPASVAASPDEDAVGEAIARALTRADLLPWPPFPGESG